ncbi:MAG: hypothetical protein DHS20C02_06800 [Micavibrio sp.]|nr:MAG: hypothetical protein DHS20C02_06800 [Micavibrio sp.]
MTALRLHPVDHLSFVIGGTIALYIFGFEGEAIVQAIFIHGAYNLFVHANINLGFPRPLCYILGSPNYHRWHHASDKEAIDKNFATMFSLFDVIFCSYYYPRDKLPKTYGLYDHSKNYPKNFTGQILYPFQRIKKK